MSTYMINSFIEFVESFYQWTPSPKVVCENAKLVGWHPVWDKESFLNSIDKEVDDCLELGLPKSSLLISLKPVSDQTTK
jgi:hypothetical protein